MRKLIGGRAFEAAVIRVLQQELGCEVHTSENLDIKHKIDGEIRVIGGKSLCMPVQFQLTRRIDNCTKLNSWLASRRPSASVSLYVEAEEGIEAHALADDLAWAAAALQWLEPYKPRCRPHFGLRVGDDAVFFDPYVRHDELRAERESERRLQALKRGLVHTILPDDFTVSGEDGSTRFAHFIEVDDGAFRQLLRRSVGDNDASFPIFYLPHGHFARDIRFREIEEPKLLIPPPAQAEPGDDHAPSEETDPSRP